MKVITRPTGLKILHYKGWILNLFYQRMMIESEHLKTYDYCNRSILNYKICTK